MKRKRRVFKFGEEISCDTRRIGLGAIAHNAGFNKNVKGQGQEVEYRLQKKYVTAEAVADLKRARRIALSICLILSSSQLENQNRCRL